MRILHAYDLGADGVELLVHLDEAQTVQGPDGAGDLRPNPAWLWRAHIPGREWTTDQIGALTRVARLAEREVRRRTKAAMPELAGTDLATYLTGEPDVR
jgi:hypothetical protein